MSAATCGIGEIAPDIAPLIRATAYSLSSVRIAPDPFFGPTKLREFLPPQRCFANGEKLIQLRRAHRRAAQHGVGLAAMMHLMLEQMQQQPVHPLALDGGAAMHGHDAL